ncbi:MAG: hypothetical protein AB1490_06860 [Pseudomonadota bacterium]
MQLLDDIVQGAVDDKTAISVLLRKCLLLAHQLKNDKLKVWAESELNGYQDNSALPPYRVVKTVARGSFAGPAGNVLNGQPLAASILPEDLRWWAETANLTQPISAYDIGKDAEGKPNGGRILWPQDLVNHVSGDFIHGWNLIRAHQEIPGTVFVSILDSVRNRILQLALELKDELDSTSENISDIPAKRVDQSVVNHIYGGNVVIAGHAENFAQVGSISVSQGNFEELSNALKQLGLDSEAISKLKQAMEADAANNSGEPTLGQRTKKWLSDAASYVGKEGLKVGFEVARRAATKWVMQHYGFDVG